jgi:hypothetical protein
VRLAARDEDEGPDQQEGQENQEVPLEAAAEPEELGEMPRIEDMVHNVHITTQKFWQEHKKGFVEMWESLSGPDRKRMIMSVFPHMPEARSELMCACGSRKKCGRGMRTISLLMPELNMEDLVGGGAQSSLDLIGLFDARTDEEDKNNISDGMHIRRAFFTENPQRQGQVVDNTGMSSL